MARVLLCRLEDVPENGNRAFTVDDKAVLVCRSSSGVFALENMCSHATSSLEGGKMKGPFLFCPLHGMRIDMRSGCPSGQLTKKPVKVYEATVEDGQVFAEL
ncbi:ferredoxin [Tardibacter chloracetimidivorans]|uniref:Ferredoxin n=1 Tax=Tardibacter chloracetimidivorans TaxID=1921510 RepID=A0A1L3ZXG2_9SPHN|nr:Rieske 2Fe-2S domain-containing protein [Tardibacter chloracetimidivorans]API60322.1 ferredoxin [Tardibacter chloracetimidivorans]